MCSRASKMLRELSLGLDNTGLHCRSGLDVYTPRNRPAVDPLGARRLSEVFHGELGEIASTVWP